MTSLNFHLAKEGEACTPLCFSDWDINSQARPDQSRPNCKNRRWYEQEGGEARKRGVSRRLVLTAKALLERRLSSYEVPASLTEIHTVTWPLKRNEALRCA